MRYAVPLPRAFLRPIAHRGLHDAATGRIENTGPAFSAAIARGYGIECDVRPAAGGLPIVFHDATLERLVDATGPVDRLTPGDLAGLRYRGQDIPLLTLAGLLALVCGRVPLLVEVKSEWDPPDRAFLEQIASAARAYAGPIALMSFDPDVVGTLADFAPTVPRGLVSGSYRAVTGDGWWHDQLSAERRADLRDMTSFNDVAASFIAYEVAALAWPAVSALRARAVPVFTWTVRTPSDRAAAARHADAMIFEGFEPQAHQ